MQGKPLIRSGSMVIRSYATLSWEPVRGVRAVSGAGARMGPLKRLATAPA
jgi:hypothetical protein